MDDFTNDKKNKHENKLEENDLNKDKPYFDGENYYTEEEFFNPNDDYDPDPKTYKYAKRVKTTIVIIVSISLLSYVFALWPKLFNLATIEFLTTSIELSKNEEVQLYKESVVVVNTESSKGTGFYFSDEGYIITNNHVIEDEQKITVSFNDGEIYPAEVISSDEIIDIAILKIDTEGKNYPVLEFEENWEPNQSVYIIGNPLYSNFVVNKGNVIGLTTRQGISMLAIDAPIYRGNSGSPVINSDGNVIGVIYATTTIDYQGTQKKVGLAIPIEYVSALGIY